MFISYPARLRFPLLKLPWLCVKCVIQNSDLYDIIYFATISNRTRRIVKSSNYPIQKIHVARNSTYKRIFMGKGKYWDFSHDEYENAVPLLLKRNSEPFLTRNSFNFVTGHSLRSYRAGDTLDALKMGIDFMIEVFGCTVNRVFVDGNKLSELIRLGISSVEELYITDSDPVNITNLKYLLETMKVTDSYAFYVPIPANFFCDPQIFNCRRINFESRHSADWVTLQFLYQLDVSKLVIRYERFSKEDIVSYITYWFNSENRKLEFVQFKLDNPVSLEDFEIVHLNPMPYDEKRRNKCPLVRGWENTDTSSGMDILRQDGLLATFFVKPTEILFYIWHKRFPDAA
ncbi:unnamed protein product [Caenorhabditis brenneri]